MLIDCNFFVTCFSHECSGGGMPRCLQGPSHGGSRTVVIILEFGVAWNCNMRGVRTPPRRGCKHPDLKCENWKENSAETQLAYQPATVDCHLSVDMLAVLPWKDHTFEEAIEIQNNLSDIVNQFHLRFLLSASKCQDVFFTWGRTVQSIH